MSNLYQKVRKGFRAVSFILFYKEIRSKLVILNVIGIFSLLFSSLDEDNGLFKLKYLFGKINCEL